MRIAQQHTGGVHIVTLHGVQHISTHTDGADRVTLILTGDQYAHLAGQLDPIAAEYGPLDLMLRYANQ